MLRPRIGLLQNLEYDLSGPEHDPSSNDYGQGMFN